MNLEKMLDEAEICLEDLGLNWESVSGGTDDYLSWVESDGLTLVRHSIKEDLQYAIGHLGDAFDWIEEDSVPKDYLKWIVKDAMKAVSDFKVTATKPKYSKDQDTVTFTVSFDGKTEELSFDGLVKDDPNKVIISSLSSFSNTHFEKDFVGVPVDEGCYIIYANKDTCKKLEEVTDMEIFRF